MGTRPTVWRAQVSGLLAPAAAPSCSAPVNPSIGGRMGTLCCTLADAVPCVGEEHPLVLRLLRRLHLRLPCTAD